MLIIIYGLGNNESKYLRTKHNAGRLVVEKIALDYGVSFTESDYFVAKKKLENGNEIWLVYSKGYMNHSGLPISKLLKYYKIENDFQLIIAQDDSDQILGKTKLVAGGGTAGHNGIISSYQHIHYIDQKNIWRLKIGIRPEGNRLKSETFVLSPITNTELDFYNETATKLITALNQNPKLDLNKLQNTVNTPTSK